MEYHAGLCNDSSSRGAKGEALSHKELIPSVTRKNETQRNGVVVVEWLVSAHYGRLWVPEQSNDRIKKQCFSTANFLCTWPDWKILDFAGHMMAVRSNQCSIAAWKQP